MNRKPQIIAALVTLLLLLATTGLLLSMHLNYSSADEARREWPPVDSAELLFANEFVAMGEVEPVENPTEAAPVAAAAPALEANDMTDAGEQAAETPKPVSTERPSEMKVRKPKKEKQGPTKAELAAQAKAKAQKEAADAISKRVNFGGKAAGGQSDNAPDSKATGGSTDGVATASVGGRSMEHWSKPTARATGTITVRVRVDRQGRVVRADYVSGTGPVATQTAARQSCEQAAMKSQFSVALDGPAVQVGTILYRFK